MLARVPAGCSVSWPEGKGPRRLTGAVVPCSEAMGEAAAGPANEMLDGSRGGFVMVGQVVQFGPSGAAFAPPVTLRLPFSAGALADLRAAGLQPRLAAFRWDGGKGCWREVAGEVREVREGGEGVVEVESKSFSSYTVGVPLSLRSRSAAASHAIPGARRPTPPSPRASRRESPQATPSKFR